MKHSAQTQRAQAPCTRRGRRRISEAMLAARDELTTPVPAEPGKRDMLNMLKSLRGALPVSRGAASTLIIMVEKTSPDAWTTLETPFIYAHNTTLMSWTGLSRSTLQRHIRELAEARLLVPQDGRNGQRGRRWQAEEGQTQVGFNLASLRYRWPDLVELSTEQRRLRKRVAFLRESIARVNDLVRAQSEDCGFQQIMEQAAGIMRARLRTDQVGPLEQLYGAMLALSTALAEPCAKPETDRNEEPVENLDFPTPYPVEMRPMGPQNGAHYTDTKNIQSSKKVDRVAANGGIRIEGMRCEGQSFRSDRSFVYDRTALRGFKGTATFYLEICSSLRDLCSSGRPSAEQLIDAAEYLSGQVGVSCHAWSQACVVLGRLQAAVAVIVMASRLERGAVIRFRDAYFRSLIERGARNTLFLDRSLYALRDHRTREVGMLAEAGGSLATVGVQNTKTRAAWI
ncbi:replicator initiator RepC [Gluconobacter kondonii]|uniref:replication initiation protein RepC n=1 Tax=Gluconobacter TaxID=441 RepID=UPI001B8C271A|nr:MULTISPECIES: replication initiation protein RepC [Gluconobacter]MBS1023039.1 replicator initiator RepC [Gluconobacter cerinus]MBS1025450.1 replicator initiator RepC [Gluconobacter cerinus]MBS1054706.1 replicator initiator RepC [Gluconobacter kondonii]MBS1078149.1 replicator initiator RepC [Gluconobacter kondonii]